MPHLRTVAAERKSGNVTPCTRCVCSPERAKARVGRLWLAGRCGHRPWRGNDCPPLAGFMARRRNSLHSLRSLWSNSRRQSVHERASRGAMKPASSGAPSLLALHGLPPRAFAAPPCSFGSQPSLQSATKHKPFAWCGWGQAVGRLLGRRRRSASGVACAARFVDRLIGTV